MLPKPKEKYFIEIVEFKWKNTIMVDDCRGLEALKISKKLGLPETNFLPAVRRKDMDLKYEISEEEAKEWTQKSPFYRTAHNWGPAWRMQISFKSVNHCILYLVKRLQWSELKPDEVEYVGGEYVFDIDWEYHWVVDPKTSRSASGKKFIPKPGKYYEEED